MINITDLISKGYSAKVEFDERTMKYQNALIKKCLLFLRERERYHQIQDSFTTRHESHNDSKDFSRIENMEPDTPRNYEESLSDRTEMEIIWREMAVSLQLFKDKGGIEESFLMVMDGTSPAAFNRVKDMPKKLLIKEIQKTIGILKAKSTLNQFKLHARHSDNFEDLPNIKE